MTLYVMETSTKYNRYAARIPKGMEVGWVGVVSSLSFDVQGQGWYCQIRTNSTDRRREVVQKLNVFHGCHKYMVPKCKIVHELQLPLCCFNLLKILWGHDWIICIQKRIQFFSVLPLSSFYEASSILVKNKKIGEGHQLIVHEE